LPVVKIDPQAYEQMSADGQQQQQQQLLPTNQSNQQTNNIDWRI